MPSISRRLVDTPSSGEDEVRAALLSVHAHNSRTVTAARLKRAFYDRVTVADITTVLTSLVSASDATDVGGNYALTTQGLGTARAHPQPRHIPLVAG